MDPTNGANNWPNKKEKKVHKRTIQKEAKVKGIQHENYKAVIVQAKQIGEDCRCKQYKCFQRTTIEERQLIFSRFYSMHDKNEQDAYLSGLITIIDISRRRPRHDCNFQKPHAAAFSYKVRCGETEKHVCLKGFIGIHGVSHHRIRRLQQSLLMVGHSPRDKRGTHANRPRKYNNEAIALIMQHIRGFSPRQSHYSRRRSPNQYYLPSELNIKVMHRLFVNEYFINVPYKMYWYVFKRKFNIKFGYPRCDTCSQCDVFQQALNNPEITPQERQRVATAKDLHQRKAEAFHTAKRGFKNKARAGELSCISFDFMQNLPLPHIPSNPVFYSRQLWYHVFGIHDLATDEATMYTYHESVAKKGANDVTSMLLHYINTHDMCRKLVLISDGCPGQNKNYTMLHFLYFLVHGLKIFDEIEYIFPVRGHSYLPNDQDFSLVEKKKRKVERIEVPEEWDKLILNSRNKPSPFKEVNVKPSMIFDIKGATEKFFLKSAKPAIKIKSVREFKIERQQPSVKLRDTYNGPWRTSLVCKTKISSEWILHPAFNSHVPIQKSKVENVQKLLGFLHDPRNKKFYNDLFLSLAAGSEENQESSDNEDNSSGCED